MQRADPRPWLHDMLDAIVGVRAAVAGRSLEAYVADWKTRRAVERGLEILSEASRRLPPPLKDSVPDVAWRQIADLGNVLRHAYHRVDDEVIYIVATQQLDDLEAATRRLLDRLPPRACG